MRETHCLGRAVAREVAADQYLDSHTGLCVCERRLRVGMGGDVAPADQPLAKQFEPSRGEQDVDVLGHAHVAVLAERHAPDDRVGNALLIEPGGEAPQRFAQAALLHEVRARLTRGRIQGLMQLGLVCALRRHATSIRPSRDGCQ